MKRKGKLNSLQKRKQASGKAGKIFKIKIKNWYYLLVLSIGVDKYMLLPFLLFIWYNWYIIGLR